MSFFLIQQSVKLFHNSVLPVCVTPVCFMVGSPYIHIWFGIFLSFSFYLTHCQEYFIRVSTELYYALRALVSLKSLMYLNDYLCF